MLIRSRRQIDHTLTKLAVGAPALHTSSTRVHRALRAVPLTTMHTELDLTTARRWLEARSNDELRAWVHLGEREAQKIEADDVGALLASARTGDTLSLPAHVLVPGQSQVSFDRVREQLLKFFTRLGGRSAAQVRALAEELGLIEVPGIILPGAQRVILPDRNHNVTALFALKGWLSSPHPDPTSPARHARTSLAEVFLGPQARVKVHVDSSLASQPEDLAERTLRARLYFVRRDGTLAAARPTRFADLEDNPFRALASHTRVKVKKTGDGKRDFTLSASDALLWLKGPGAPEFIELHIAAVFERALEDAGRTWSHGQRLTPTDVDTLRRALTAACNDPDHPSAKVFEELVVIPNHLANLGALRALLRVGKKRGLQLEAWAPTTS